MKKVDFDLTEVLNKHYRISANSVIDCANSVLQTLANAGLHPRDIYQWASDFKHEALVREKDHQNSLFTSRDSKTYTEAAANWLGDEYSACVAMLVMSLCYCNWPQFEKDYKESRRKFKSKHAERMLDA